MGCGRKQTSLKWSAKRRPKMQQRGEHRTPPVWTNSECGSEWECCSVVAETSVKRTWTECTLATPHAFRAFFNFLRFFSVLYSLVKIDLSSLLTFFHRPRNHFLFTQHFVLSSGCLFLLGDREEGAGFSFEEGAIVKRVSFFRFRDKKRWLEREEEVFWVFTCWSGFFRLPLDHIRPQGSHSSWWARVLRSFWCNC